VANRSLPLLRGIEHPVIVVSQRPDGPWMIGGERDVSAAQ
jgi:hypothetical protein